MSKISDYIELVRRSRQPSKNETVAEYAGSLNQSVDYLIEQLKAAGLSVARPEDRMTQEAKEALLNHLRKAHVTPETSKTRIQIQTKAERLLLAASNNESGAELEVLVDLANAVIWDEPIDPLLQQLANIIIAKAVITGSLPSKRRGRPISEGAHEFGEALAWEFWNMRDAGVPYKVAIQALSERHHKDERHLSRIVKDYTRGFEKTREGRDKHRFMLNYLAEHWHSNGSSPLEKIMSAAIDLPEAPELTEQDYLDHLNDKFKKIDSE